MRGVAEGGIVKKYVCFFTGSHTRLIRYDRKKHKSRSKTKEREKSAETEIAKELELLKKEDDLKSSSPSGSGRNSPAIASSSGSSERKTPAEKRFEEVQRKRVCIQSLLVGATHR